MGRQKSSLTATLMAKTVAPTSSEICLKTKRSGRLDPQLTLEVVKLKRRLNIVGGVSSLKTKTFTKDHLSSSLLVHEKWRDHAAFAKRL